MLTLTRLKETVYAAPEHVDEKNGILRGCKLLAEHSRNNRRYPPRVMRESTPKYNGRKSYFDHAESERLWEEWIGTFRQPRYSEGIVADLHLRQQGPRYEEIIEAALKFPSDVGFSHAASGPTRMEGSVEVVESIEEVFSVDLVLQPATTRGLFESSQRSPERQKTIAALVDGADKIRKAVRAIFNSSAPLEFGEEIAALTVLLRSAEDWLRDPDRVLDDAMARETLNRIADSTYEVLKSPTQDGAAGAADAALDALVEMLRDLANWRTTDPAIAVAESRLYLGQQPTPPIDSRKFFAEKFGSVLSDTEIFALSIMDDRQPNRRLVERAKQAQRDLEQKRNQETEAARRERFVKSLR